MKVKIVKSILWFFIGVAAVVGVARFISGLGPASALSDTTPWGLWIGFDILCGVALAAGGFVVAAMVYVFKREDYHHLARPAVLTACLGYIAVVGGLIFDLGMPWNIWRMTIHWQHHSPLFEVGMCVMFYLTVLILEFSPVVLEKSPFHKLYNFMKKMTLPLVILGIMLSTLHQSSLGTLFLIMPFRLHPLWQSSIQPLMFLVSAIGLGLGMVCVESMFTSWLYNKKQETPLLSGLAKAATWVLGIYFVLRVGDLTFRGDINQLFSGTWESALFISEMILIVAIPMVLFIPKKIRSTLPGVGFGAVSLVLGVMVNRLAVGGLAQISATSSIYFPSWMEISISLGVVSAAILAFLFFVENFKVYEKEAMDKAPLHAIPEPDPISNIRLAAPWAPAWREYSFVFIIGACLTFAALPKDILEGAQPVPVPTHAPKSALAEGKNALLIDADLNGDGVLFTHQAHQERNESCSKCHHMNRPDDRATACYICHTDMYRTNNVFDHKLHEKGFECAECHTDLSLVKNRDTAKACRDCHETMPARVGMAAGYKQAMHKLCVECHQDQVANNDKDPNFARCAACHKNSMETKR